VIKTVVAHEMALVRGALSLVLSTEDDIEVVAELGRAEDVAPSVLAQHPDVAVVDLDLVKPTDISAVNTLNGCRVLVLTDPRRSSALMPLMSQQHANPIGFVVHDGPPDRLVDAVRRVAKGEPVIDPELVVAALHTQCPLTPREIDVLAVTAEGASVKEAATRLNLAPGTVRNHLSRILTKTSASSRLHAVRIAQESGWI
jgi:two-component system, NarL family, response regulator DesR